MWAYHPIHWVETIHWHDIFTDKRFWAVVAVVGFIALLTLLVVMSPKTGSTTPPYYGPWPYGPMPIK